MGSNPSFKRQALTGILLVSFFFFSGCVSVRTSPSRDVTEAFRISQPNLIPEGIAYDPSDKSFYVGSIARRKIVRVDSKGKASDFALSLDQILGLKVDTLSRQLWACGNSVPDSGRYSSVVYLFDLADRSLLKKYQISGKKKHLFNDIVVTSGGDAYVTDSDGGAIFVIRKTRDAIEEFIKPGSISGPNGVTLSPDESRLLVATAGSQGIVSIDLTTREIKPLKSDRYLLIGFDGIYRFKDSIIGIQNVTFPESVLRLSCDDEFSAVNRVEFIAVSVPQFHIPTTGVVVGNFFYFIANSQVDQVAGNNAGIRDSAALSDPIIMKVRL